jgi:integrase
MAYAGLRRAELVGLDWDDIGLSRRLLRVRAAKGGRPRTTPPEKIRLAERRLGDWRRRARPRS